VKFQWLQHPTNINEDNLNNVRCKANRHFRNKINELVRKSKNKNITELYRGTNKFEWGYQPRSNLVRDENGDLLPDSNNSLNRWRNYFYQLLNLHSVIDVRQIEIYTVEPLVSDPSPFKTEIAIAELKKYKLPGSDQIPAQLIYVGGETILTGIHKLIKFLWKREEFFYQ
jgi:hypothetical protein